MPIHRPIGPSTTKFLTFVAAAALQLATVAFFAWKIRLHTAIIIILTAGVVVTWFVPRRYVALAIGVTLLVGAAVTDLMDVRSEIGYTAAGLAVVTGAVVLWRD